MFEFNYQGKEGKKKRSKYNDTNVAQRRGVIINVKRKNTEIITNNYTGCSERDGEIRIIPSYK